ncbi:urea transporter [Pseudorhodoplanes sp.]|uniref:urea transporter n=1 Tax=Pseudorhodoplanes sp. TaxID=1934341 RepID=UPI003D11E661
MNWWKNHRGSSTPVWFADVCLRGIAQVMLQNNPLTGALFLAAIAWASFASDAYRLAIAAILAVIVATLTAQWLRVDPDELESGLYGYNATLVGLTLATFLAPGALLWFYVVFGAIVSVIATLATFNVLKPWGLPALTSPFVLVAWLMLLATYGFAGLSGESLPSGAVVGAYQAYHNDPLDIFGFIQGFFKSISQVFLKADGIAAVLLVAGLLVSSPAAAAFAVGGAILAVATAHLLGAESQLITGGLLGFSPVLTAITLGTVFYKPSPRVAAYAALGTAFTVVAQAATNMALTPLAIPALTAPFVLVSWMFLLPRPCLETTRPAKTPHEEGGA